MNDEGENCFSLELRGIWIALASVRLLGLFLPLPIACSCQLPPSRKELRWRDGLAVTIPRSCGNLAAENEEKGLGKSGGADVQGTKISPQKDLYKTLLETGESCRPQHDLHLMLPFYKNDIHLSHLPLDKVLHF